MTVEEMETHFKPHFTKSVGYLMKTHKDYIILAFVDFGNGLYKHWQVIPKGMIKKQKVIKNE